MCLLYTSYDTCHVQFTITLLHSHGNTQQWKVRLKSVLFRVRISNSPLFPFNKLFRQSVTSDSSLLQSSQLQVPQSLLIGQVTKSMHHLCCWSLNLFQQSVPSDSSLLQSSPKSSPRVRWLSTGITAHSLSQAQGCVCTAFQLGGDVEQPWLMTKYEAIYKPEVHRQKRTEPRPQATRTRNWWSLTILILHRKYVFTIHVRRYVSCAIYYQRISLCFI